MTSIKRSIALAKKETGSQQARRLVDYLADHPNTLTGEICKATSIGNLSAAANRIRPALQKRGLTIVSELPNKRIYNKFGEPSMSHRWRIQSLEQ